MVNVQIDMQNLTSQQCRAARAFLGWSLIEASRHTELSISTISRAEQNEKSVKNNSAQDLVKKCYEKSGINFVSLNECQGILLTNPQQKTAC